MNPRPRSRLYVTSLLLSGTALLTIAAPHASSVAAPLEAPFTMAQAAAPDDADKDKPKRPPREPGAKPQPQTAPPTAQQPGRPTPPAAAQDRRDDRREDRRDGQREDRRQPAPSTAQQPPAAAPPTAQQPGRPTPPAAAQDRRDDRREDRRDGQREDRRQPAPSTAQQPQTPPSTAQQPPATPPAAQQQRPAPSTAQQPQPQTAQQPQPPATPPAAQQQQQQQQPAPAAPTAQQPVAPPAAAARTDNPAVVAPPTQARDAREFLRRDGASSTRGISQVRQERQESRDGDRTIIREPDRTIIREGNRTIIRHNESNRFAIDARNVRTERRGANTETIVERGNGVTIVTVTDADGRLLRRSRRDRDGRDVVIIDNSFAGSRGATLFIQLAPPVIRIPRERYIVEAHRARPDDIYEVFIAAPVERIDQRYTLDQVRYNAPLRDRMPRLDLDITFETGSWQLAPDQVERLAAIATGLNRALERNPREVFMIEGHTDAVGQDVDNLSLSDRRAESVAVALTEQFQVPAENLVTQGYGEQYLKVPTDGPDQANRRVAVRRITPLLDQQMSKTGAR